MQKLISLFLIICSALSLMTAQKMSPGQRPRIGVIQGTVLDSLTKQPIEYASITLSRKKDGNIVTGGISNKNGSFIIRNIPAGQYTVVVEFIGFDKKVFNDIKFNPRTNETEHDLGTILLSQGVLPVESIIVEGERPIYLQTLEKKIFNVEQNTISSGGNVLDALRQVPGVDVDIDGNVSLRGSANVTVFIDGKPSVLTGNDRAAILENIPSDNVQDIEVITNPSAKYDPDGMAGIINIVLKENKLKGINGSVSSSISTLASRHISGQLNFLNEKWNFFTNATGRHNVRSGGGDTFRETYFPQSTQTLNQIIDGERGGDSFLLKTGVEYRATPKDLLGFTLTYNKSDRIFDRIVSTQEELSIPDSLTRLVSYDQITEGNNSQNGSDFTFTYDRKFARQKQMLSFYINRSDGESNRVDLLTNNSTDDTPVISDFISDRITTLNLNQTNTVQLDYTHPLNENIKFETGFKGTLRKIDTDYITESAVNYTGFVTDSVRSNHFVFDESIRAVYGMVTIRKDRVGFQAGLRGELASTTSKLLDTDEEFDNPYESLFPSFSLSYGSQETSQAQISYSRRINRPSHRRLNPAIFQLDQLNIRVGNPFLKPEYIDVAELNYSRFIRGKSVSVSTYFRRITDKINPYKYVREEDGVSVRTYENFDEKRTYGAEFVMTGSVTPTLRLMLNANAYVDEVDASNVFSGDYDKTSSGYMLRFTATWNALPSTEVMMTGFYRSPRDIPVGQIGSMSFTSLSIKRKFMKERLSLTLKMNDIFNTMGFDFEAQDVNYYQTSSRRWDSQVASITVEYRFGKVEDNSQFSRKRRSGNNGDSDMNGFEIE